MLFTRIPPEVFWITNSLHSTDVCNPFAHMSHSLTLSLWHQFQNIFFTGFWPCSWQFTIYSPLMSYALELFLIDPRFLTHLAFQPVYPYRLVKRLIAIWSSKTYFLHESLRSPWINRVTSGIKVTFNNL